MEAVHISQQNRKKVLSLMHTVYWSPKFVLMQPPQSQHVFFALTRMWGATSAEGSTATHSSGRYHSSCTLCDVSESLASPGEGHAQLGL